MRLDVQVSMYAAILSVNYIVIFYNYYMTIEQIYGQRICDNT